MIKLVYNGTESICSRGTEIWDLAPSNINYKMETCKLSLRPTLQNIQSKCRVFIKKTSNLKILADVEMCTNICVSCI